MSKTSAKLKYVFFMCPGYEEGRQHKLEEEGVQVWSVGEALCLSAGDRSTIYAMQVATGTVVDGKIVLEGVPLTEGAVVAVVIRGADENFTLTEAQEEELLAAMAEIERGDYVTLEDLLQSLPKNS